MQKSWKFEFCIAPREDASLILSSSLISRSIIFLLGQIFKWPFFHSYTIHNKNASISCWMSLLQFLTVPEVRYFFFGVPSQAPVLGSKQTTPAPDQIMTYHHLTFLSFHDFWIKGLSHNAFPWQPTDMRTATNILSGTAVECCGTDMHYEAFSLRDKSNTPEHFSPPLSLPNILKLQNLLHLNYIKFVDRQIQRRGMFCQILR